LDTWFAEVVEPRLRGEAFVTQFADDFYLDTSVLGGYFDEEFAETRQELWRQMKPGHFRFVSSLWVAQELTEAPLPE
jgi:hypothetical protein